MEANQQNTPTTPISNDAHVNTDRTVDPTENFYKKVMVEGANPDSVAQSSVNIDSRTTLPTDVPTPSYFNIAPVPQPSAVKETPQVSTPVPKEEIVSNAPTESYLGSAFSTVGSLFRYTKHYVMDTLGTKKDPIMEGHTAYLIEIKAQYEEIGRLGAQLCDQMLVMSRTMDELGTFLTSISMREPSLDATRQTGSSFRLLHRHNESYVSSLRIVYQTLRQFNEKIIEDAWETCKRYAQLKTEYDVAYENLQIANSSHNSQQIAIAQSDFSLIDPKFREIRDSFQLKMEALKQKRRVDLEQQMAAYFANMVTFYYNSFALLQPKQK